MKPFELLVIVKPGLGDEAVAACRGRVEGWLTDGGAAALEVADLGEMPLAYEVGKQSRGHFLLFWFEGPPELPEAVGRRIKIDEEVVRHLVVERHRLSLNVIKAAGEEKERERDRDRDRDRDRYRGRERERSDGKRS